MTTTHILPITFPFVLTGDGKMFYNILEALPQMVDTRGFPKNEFPSFSYFELGYSGYNYHALVYSPALLERVLDCDNPNDVVWAFAIVLDQMSAYTQVSFELFKTAWGERFENSTTCQHVYDKWAAQRQQQRLAKHVDAGRDSIERKI